MDRREAIQIVADAFSAYESEYRCIGENAKWDNIHEALDLAIEALGQKSYFHCPKCGTIIRDGRQCHDTVYRGEAEPKEMTLEEWQELDKAIRGDAESATTTDCISRADTIKALCQECKVFLGDGVNCADCTEVAIVKGMPPVNQNQITGKLESAETATSDGEESTMNQPKSKLDCISRQQAIEAVEKQYFAGTVADINPSWRRLHNILESLPPVTPTERTGEWAVEEKDCIYGKKIRLTCSECGDVFDVTESAYPYERYCRYCGARMNKGEEV